MIKHVDSLVLLGMDKKDENQKGNEEGKDAVKEEAKPVKVKKTINPERVVPKKRVFLDLMGQE